MKSLNARLLSTIVFARSGFILLELVIAVTILATVSGLIVTATFQILAVQRGFQDEGEAARELRHAGSRFAGDALNAATTTLVDLGPATSSVSLHWIDVEKVHHAATYTASGKRLLRDYDGDQLAMARRLVTAEFSLPGGVLTFYLEVEAGEGATASTTLTTFLRHLQ